jgi:hypothetical protein
VLMRAVALLVCIASAGCRSSSTRNADHTGSGTGCLGARLPLPGAYAGTAEPAGIGARRRTASAGEAVSGATVRACCSCCECCSSCSAFRCS